MRTNYKESICKRYYCSLSEALKNCTFHNVLLFCFQVMFEKYQFGGVYVAIQAVLTLYAQGKHYEL